MNIKEINTAIISGTFTNEQLNSIGDAVKFARKGSVHRTQWRDLWHCGKGSHQTCYGHDFSGSLCSALKHVDSSVIWQYN
jgi:hypothetical protein